MNLFLLFKKKIKFIISTKIKCSFYSIKMKYSNFYADLIIKNVIFSWFWCKIHENKAIFF
jgi:hypothetical protein